MKPHTLVQLFFIAAGKMKQAEHLGDNSAKCSLRLCYFQFGSASSSFSFKEGGGGGWRSIIYQRHNPSVVQGRSYMDHSSWRSQVWLLLLSFTLFMALLKFLPSLPQTLNKDGRSLCDVTHWLTVSLLHGRHLGLTPPVLLIWYKHLKTQRTHQATSQLWWQ